MSVLERVKDEYVELTEKHKKLQAFLERGSGLDILTSYHIVLLEQQEEIMDDYRKVLMERIKDME